MLYKDEIGPLATIDVLILCGGLGNRLRPVVSDRPKGLASIGGRPFMDILVEELLRQGFQRIIFCVGYLKEQIIAWYKTRGDAEYLFSQEDVPLGTGGAVQNAWPLIHSNPFLVLNGDSLCSVEFRKFYEFHLDKSATASLVLTVPEGRHDGGMVSLNEAHQIQSFNEKSAPHHHACFINTGMYLLQQDEAIILERMPAPFSLEYDVFPVLVKAKPCFGFVVQSRLIDIGTPERYWQANKDARQ